MFNNSNVCCRRLTDAPQAPVQHVKLFFSKCFGDLKEHLEGFSFRAARANSGGPQWWLGEAMAALMKALARLSSCEAHESRMLISGLAWAAERASN